MAGAGQFGAVRARADRAAEGGAGEGEREDRGVAVAADEDRLAAAVDGDEHLPADGAELGVLGEAEAERAALALDRSHALDRAAAADDGHADRTCPEGQGLAAGAGWGGEARIGGVDHGRSIAHRRRGG